LNIIISRTYTKEALDVENKDTQLVENKDTQLVEKKAVIEVESKDLLEEHLTHGILHFTDILECAKYCMKHLSNRKLFVIGGQQIYDWFYDKQLIVEEYITEVTGVHDCDVYFNHTNYANQDKYDEKLLQVVKTDTYECKMFHRVHKNTEEIAMLNLMKLIIQSGESSMDRTLVGTKSIFGYQLTFDLSNNVFPLMTTKKMFFRGIFEELMFYLRGQTDNTILQKKGIHVWDGNTTREFLNKRGLHHLPVGDMGHSYGFSFRHFGGTYVDCKTDYHKCRCTMVDKKLLPLMEILYEQGFENEVQTIVGNAYDKKHPDNACPLNGFDQLTWLVNEIKTNPTSRRLRISLWEPNKMDQAALPPCLEQYQFYVRDGYISCMMTQRSSDYFLAGGWNVATGALLTILLAKVTGLEPSLLVWNIGDVHLYNNLLDQVQLQMTRTPHMFPRLYVRQLDNITDYQLADVELVGYKSHAAIKGVMNA
jgi:thymidylate synthase